MHTGIKVTIGFTAGLATGALVTHLYYKETIDNTVDRKVFTILGEQNKDKKKKDIKVDQILSTHLPTQPKELDISNVPAGTIDYTKFYEQANPEAVAYPSEDEDYIHDDLEGASMTMNHEEAIKKGPRLLTYEEFQQPTNNIIKHLCFYPESGILTDMETEEEMFRMWRQMMEEKQTIENTLSENEQLERVIEESIQNQEAIEKAKEESISNSGIKL